MAVIDSRLFRDAMARFATGVAVVTTRDTTGRPVGVTINSLSSVSLEPPLLLWSLALKAPSLEAFRQSGLFAVNILPGSRDDLCRQFATPAPDKFRGVRYTVDCHGLPLLDDVLAQLVCRTWARYPGGDHEIFVGQVEDIRIAEGEPLVFFRGRLATLENPCSIGA